MSHLQHTGSLGWFHWVHRFSGCGMQAQKLGAQAAECRALAVAANGLSGCGTQAPDQAAQWWCCVGTAVCKILVSQPGIKSSAFQGRLLTTGPPGNFLGMCHSKLPC